VHDDGPDAHQRAFRLADLDAGENAGVGADVSAIK